jgi:hypothetical protein
MSRIGTGRFIIAALFAASLVACVDSPSAAADPLAAGTENQLATSFEGLAQEQNDAGDVERAEEFRWAALAVRAGVQPARYEVSNNGVREVYSAFVHAAHWVTPALAMRPIGHRTFIAWRKESDVMKVIIIGSFSESAPILHPYSLRLAQPGGVLSSPIAAANGAYFERGTNRSFWIGVGGQVKIEEKSASGSCVRPNDQAPPSGVTCQPARYDVAFDMTVALTLPNSRIVAVAAPTKTLEAEEQNVGGVKLTFSCVAPASDRGCN